jgi:hypothetical protein
MCIRDRLHLLPENHEKYSRDFYTYTNCRGEFSFSCPNGRYKLIISDKNYSLTSSVDRKLLDLFDGPFYNGKLLLIGTNSRTNLDIAVNLQTPSFLAGKAQKLLVFDYIVSILSIAYLPLIVIGILLAISDLAAFPSPPTTLRPILYLGLAFFAVRRLLLPKISGQVLDIKNRKPLKFAVLRVYRKTNDEMELVTAVPSNSSGNFKILLRPSRYFIYTACQNYQVIKPDRLVVPKDYIEMRIQIFLLHHLTAVSLKQAVKFTKN